MEVKNKMNLSVRSIYKIMKEETDKQVSRASAIALRNEVEEKGFEIAEEATKIAERDGRKTVMKEDIREVIGY